MATKEKTATPQEARTFEKIVKLPRDNASYGGFLMQLDVGELTICAQRLGQSATGKVTISRRAFEKLVRWYQTGAM